MVIFSSVLAPGAYSGCFLEEYQKILTRYGQEALCAKRYDSGHVRKLAGFSDVPLLLEFIENPRSPLLNPLKRHVLMDSHPQEECPLCCFEQRRPSQVMEEVSVDGGLDCLLTTVTREYAPEHIMMVAKNPYPQFVFSERALRTILCAAWALGSQYQAWINSKGAGAGTYTHFHVHLSRQCVPLWRWIGISGRTTSLVRAKNGVLCYELLGWPARARLYEAHGINMLERELIEDIAALNKDNIPSALLVRVLSGGILQVIVGIRKWSDTNGSTTILAPHEGPWLWYPRLGATSVPGGVIYAIGEPFNLNANQERVIVTRFLEEMRTHSDWSWKPTGDQM